MITAISPVMPSSSPIAAAMKSLRASGVRPGRPRPRPVPSRPPQAMPNWALITGSYGRDVEQHHEQPEEQQRGPQVPLQDQNREADQPDHRNRAEVAGPGQV